MERCSRTPRNSPHDHGAGKVLALIACAVALAACGDKVTKNYVTEAPAPTVGNLNVNVNPASAAVVVTGPSNFSQSFVGDEFLAALEPGRYTVKVAAPGFIGATSDIGVVAGETSSLLLVLTANPIIAEGPRAVYRDGQGNLIPIDAISLQSGQFVFYAWLENGPLGIAPGVLTGTTPGDPGKPLIGEQTEFAPSFTQNLAAAWVGFMDPAGIVRPVIGADVRWEIDQQYAARVGSTQFGTSDDNRVAAGYGVFDDQADTRTNNARLAAERFPLVASEFPLYNQSGIGTPFVDGFTWVTLFSPDKTASSRIVAVATINGEEIGKQILYKNFAPAPKIEITKSVSADVVNLVGGTATVTWTVTVTNAGTGDATTVSLEDFLASGAGAAYSIAGLPAGSTPVGDGFTYTFPLPSAFSPALPQSSQLLGNAWNFAVLANSTVTSTGSSVVSGNVGVSAGSAVTGFPPGITLNGTIHNNDAVATAAQTAVTTANTALLAKSCTDSTNKALTGTFTPGVYCYSSSAALTGPLVLDAQGDPSAEFVFKIGSTLTTPAGASISLKNGASTCNVYWVVGSSATLGSNSFFVGNILAQASITATTGASISGRALARTGSVTLDTNAIQAPLTCVKAPGATETVTFTATVTQPGTYCNEAQITGYTSPSGSVTPVGVNDQACFTALESNLSIVKDFVADDNTTSLGKSKTVAANVPAKLRVRVINSGTGAATGVQVADAFTAAGSTGVLADYKVISVAPGTMTSGGFTNTVGGLAVGETATMLFTVSASVDARYCDTATVTATSGTIGIGSDTACLTVATPNLTITKVDAPSTVVPGASYTSTIVVTNGGTATAKNVVISDLLGLNSAAGVQTIYVSSSLDGAGGTLAINTVTASTIDILASESKTFTVVSRIPLGAIAGEYCDTATVTASNSATKQASDCVTVPAFSALQTQLVDLNDPVVVGGSTTYFSVLYVESLSNQGVRANKLTYSLGHLSSTGIGSAGVFRIISTRVYVDSAPVRDPVTGVVISDTANPTAVLQTAGTDYTVNDATPGLEVITMTPATVLHPNTAIYVVQVVSVPTGTPSQLYNTSYVWDSVSEGTAATPYQTNKSEPTTVIQ